MTWIVRSRELVGKKAWTFKCYYDQIAEYLLFSSTAKYLAEVHARETRFFNSHEASTQIHLDQSSSVYNV